MPTPGPLRSKRTTKVTRQRRSVHSVAVPPPSTVDVGARLRELRAEHGFSIRALAEHSQLNVNTLSLIEHNKTSPSVSTLQQVAAALGNHQ